MISLYCYSLSSAVVVSVLCVVPSNVLQWILMGYGFVTSTYLLLNTLSRVIVNVDEPIKYSVLGALCACQVALFVMIKLVFLNMDK